MSGDEVPAAVRDLIAEAIDSIVELEAILLLRRNRERAWSAEEAGQRLYVSRTVSAWILGELAGRGFLVEDRGMYRYEPRTPGIDQAVTELAAAYSRNLIAVTQLVHAKPGRGVLDFARAFRLRKED